MLANRVQCISCRFPIIAETSQDWQTQTCPSCSIVQSALVFPAIRGIRVEPRAESPGLIEGLAVCFFHSGKPAIIPCDMCGRFLCALCDLEIDKSHICTICLQAAQQEKTPIGAKPLSQLKEQTFLPQNLAILLAAYAPASLMGLYVLFLTSPAVVYISIRYWNAPAGIQKRGKWRFVFSLIMALLQILSMIGFGVFMYYVIAKAGAKK